MRYLRTLRSNCLCTLRTAAGQLRRWRRSPTLSINNLAGRSHLRTARPKRARITQPTLQRRKRGAKGPRSARKRAEKATLARNAPRRTIVRKIPHLPLISNAEKRGTRRQIARAISLERSQRNALTQEKRRGERSNSTPSRLHRPS
jgi:hypothetical protein